MKGLTVAHTRAHMRETKEGREPRSRGANDAGQAQGHCPAEGAATRKAEESECQGSDGDKGLMCTFQFNPHNLVGPALLPTPLYRSEKRGSEQSHDLKKRRPSLGRAAEESLLNGMLFSQGRRTLSPATQVFCLNSSSSFPSLLQRLRSRWLPLSEAHNSLCLLIS